MIRSGEEYLESLRDGRTVYIDGECDRGSVLDYVGELLQSYAPGPMLDKGATG